MSSPPPALAQLLGNATRRAILRLMLAEDAPPYCPADLSKLVGVDLPTVAYHVRVLEQADGVQLDHVEDGRGSLRHFYVPGALVKAHPEYVSAVLGEDDSPA